MSPATTAVHQAELNDRGEANGKHQAQRREAAVEVLFGELGPAADDGSLAHHAIAHNRRQPRVCGEFRAALIPPHQRLEEDGTLVCAGMADPHMSALELADAALAAAAATRKHEQGSASATTCSSSASAASSSSPPSASAYGGAPDSPEGHADLQDAEILVNVAL